MLAGAEAGAAAAGARAGLRARPRRDRRRRRCERARLIFINYPNNPTGAVVPDGLLRAGRRASPASTRSSSSTTTPTRRRPTTATSRRASSRRPGAKEVGVEVFSLSKGFNMTGWRCAAILGNADADPDLLAAEDQRRLGPLRGGAARRRGGARGPARADRRDERDLRAAPRPGGRRPARDRRRRGDAPKGTIYVWAPVPEGHTSTSFAELVLEEAAVVDLAGLDVRAVAARASSGSR